MGFELKKPFTEYVAIDPLPRTGDAAKFVLTFPFQIEGTDKVETRRVEWTYSGTQEAIDQKAGVDGVGARMQRAYEQLEKIVRDELATRGGRIYEKDGQRIPIWGKK